MKKQENLISTIFQRVAFVFIMNAVLGYLIDRLLRTMSFEFVMIMFGSAIWSFLPLFKVAGIKSKLLGAVGTTIVTLLNFAVIFIVTVKH